MEALNKTTLHGNWAPLLLPIRGDEAIDDEILRREIDLLISMKVNGIYSNGTAGEFYAQTEDEFDEVSGLLAEKCNAAGMPFQIGCCHVSPQVSLARLRRVLHLKPSAIQIILPDWLPPALPEIIDFLSRMQAAAGNIGLVLYNPPHAKVNLCPDDFREIKNSGISLLGCKVSGGDPQWYAAMKAADPDLRLFVPGHTLATGISQGAHGAYSNVACLHPRVAQKWYETMVTDMPKAMELETRIRHFIDYYIIPYITSEKFSGPAIDKFLAAVGAWGNIGTKVRWPYRSIGDDEVTAVRKICRTILPEFMEDQNFL